jgi:hypothetical protein
MPVIHIPIAITDADIVRFRTEAARFGFKPGRKETDADMVRWLAHKYLGKAGDHAGTPYTEVYLRYLGCLGLLAEASVKVDEDIRERIELAFEQACKHHPLVWKRVLNRIEIAPKEGT